MRHFIAYHNTEKMGYHLQAGNPLGLMTNKTVQHLLQNTVWFIAGEGDPRQYALGSVFRVAEVGETNEDDFKRFASGPGHVFQPPAPVKDLDWFPAALRLTAHFSLGVQEVKDETVIAGLTGIAREAGYDAS